MSQHYTSGRQGQGSRRRSNNNRQGRNSNGSNGNRRQGRGNGRFNREPRPVKLTFWQKILKAIGLYSPNKTGRKKQQPAEKNERKTNIRIAKPRNESRVPTSKVPVNSSRLYVGNLSYEATEPDLEDLFKGIGAVRSVEVIYNPRTHKSKGYAFIEMQFMDDAVRAVEVLHNQPFMGRLMTVSAANERQDSEEEETFDSTPAGFDPDDVQEETRIA